MGHTFFLGTKYSQVLNAHYQNESGKRELLQMGCFGIGVSRLLAATVEVLAHGGNIRWPWEIVPYRICLIGPKVRRLICILIEKSKMPDLYYKHSVTCCTVDKRRPSKSDGLALSYKGRFCVKCHQEV